MGSGVKASTLLKTPSCSGGYGSIRNVSLSPRHAMFGRASIRQARILDGLPVCTDLNTKIWMSEAGVPVIKQPFYAKANLGRAMRQWNPISWELPSCR
jgi:hypothetical protein